MQIAGPGILQFSRKNKKSAYFFARRFLRCVLLTERQEEASNKSVSRIRYGIGALKSLTLDGNRYPMLKLL